MRAAFAVHVGGIDVTSRLNPYLVALSVKDLSGGVADTCSITLSDSYGELPLPGLGSQIEVALGWEETGPVPVFAGYIDALKSVGSRDGRYLTISGSSADVTGSLLKQPQEAHVDNTSLGTAAATFGAKAGVGVFAHPAIAGIVRDWWGINGESFLSWGQRIADEVGGTFKIVGSRAVMLPRGGGLSASGLGLGGVVARAGDNLIAWDIDPQIGRPPHAAFAARYFDLAKTQWLSAVVGASGLGALFGAAAQALARFPAADAGGASDEAGAASAEASRTAGTGRCTIVGEPAARSQASCTIVGARAGVDATYLIDAAEHRLDRDGGYLTLLDLVQPDGAGAGWNIGPPSTAGGEVPIPPVPGFPG